MIRKLPIESNHKRCSRHGCTVVILCVGFFSDRLCVRFSDSYVSLGVIILAVFATREINALSLSLCVIVSCFFLLMEDSLACRTLGSVFMKRRYPFHGVSVRFSVKLAFLLSAPVSYFIGYIFMSIDIRISPIGMLFPSSFLQSSWLEVH